MQEKKNPSAKIRERKTIITLVTSLGMNKNAIAFLFIQTTIFKNVPCLGSRQTKMSPQGNILLYMIRNHIEQIFADTKVKL